MNKFSWYQAKSIEDAMSKANRTLAEEVYQPEGNAAIYKSGGIDLLDLMKEGLVRPDVVVNIREIQGLDIISYDPTRGLSIGANAILSDIAADSKVREVFPALASAINHAATPQLRNVSTLGGNLAQRNRCWYFRSTDHPCYRKNGDRCYARHSKTGQNEGHAIINNGSCVSVHASSIATALLALEAKVVIQTKNTKKEVAIEDFFVSPSEDMSRENILQSNDLITHILLPTPSVLSRSSYIKQVARESYDWSLGDVAVVAEMKGKTCQKATIALGAAAPTPIRCYDGEKMLVNQEITEKLALQVSEKIMEAARPLSKNAYKIPLFKGIITQALMAVTK